MLFEANKKDYRVGQTFGEFVWEWDSQLKWVF